jgi:hypothetical protein
MGTVEYKEDWFWKNNATKMACNNTALHKKEVPTSQGDVAITEMREKD